MDNLDALEQKVDRMEKVLDEVKIALIGNDYSKTGLVHTVAEHHQRLNTLERLMERGKWLLIGLSAGSGVGIYEIIKNIVAAS